MALRLARRRHLPRGFAPLLRRARRARGAGALAPAPGPAGEWLTDRQRREATEFLERFAAGGGDDAARRFFLEVWFDAPHKPLEPVEPEYSTVYAAQGRSAARDTPPKKSGQPAQPVKSSARHARHKSGASALPPARIAPRAAAARRARGGGRRRRRALLTGKAKPKGAEAVRM